MRTGVQIQTSLALFARIFEYLDLPVDIRSARSPSELPEVRGDVRFEGVSFAYEPGSPTLTERRRSTSRPAAPSPSSAPPARARPPSATCVARLYDPDRRPGHPRRRRRAGPRACRGLARTVGIVSQETYLLHASIADNLRFAKPDATDEEMVAAARAAQHPRPIASLPDGYDTVVGERGYRFSGGEKQRLAIARTILRNPPVLVLDEATSALDTRTERAVQEALDELSAGRTTVTIAHRLSTVRHADRIVVLDGGRMVERGSHEELLARGGRYAELVAADEPLALAA